MEKVGLQSLSLRQHCFANYFSVGVLLALSPYIARVFHLTFRTSQAALERISFSPGRFSPKLWTLLRKYGIFSIGASSGWRSRKVAELEFLSLGQEGSKRLRTRGVQRPLAGQTL